MDARESVAASMNGSTMESETERTGAAATVPGQRQPITLPNSPEQREGLQELADLLRTVAEYFKNKDVRELADRADLWSKRVRRLLERAEAEAAEAAEAAAGPAEAPTSVE